MSKPLTSLRYNQDTNDSEALFLTSFGRKGHSTVLEYDIDLSVSILDLYRDLTSITKAIPCIAGLGTYTFRQGALKVLSVVQCTDYVSLSIMATVTPGIANELEQYLHKNGRQRNKKDGVYDIDITHWYLDRTNSPDGCLDNLDHNRYTDSFDTLIPEMYPRIDISEMMRQYSISDESIMLLLGQPGTGKTCVAKMMMVAHALTQKKDINVVYVKDRDILKMDRFWAVMSKVEPDMMILDDLDNELLPRGVDGNSIVSNLLSYSDGIFDVGTKILITSNLTDSKVDKALVRPGRSFDTLCLPQLSREEALKIWLNTYELSENEFNNRFTDLHTISQAALASERARSLKSGSPTYLLDPSISVRTLMEEGETIRSV